MDQRFKLEDREHEAIYAEIEFYAFDGTSPVENPRVIITGGQPGSGKSKLLEASKQDLPDGNVVVLRRHA